MKLKPKVIKKAITTAGTREQLTTAEIEVPFVRIQPLEGNTDAIFVGDKQVSSTNGLELIQYLASATGGGAHLPNFIDLNPASFGVPDAKISLKDIWLDSAVGGEGVIAFYLEEVE